MGAIVEELKRIRKEKGISISELARRMGTDRARISEIENGRHGLSLRRMFDWAEALGVKVEVKFY